MTAQLRRCDERGEILIKRYQAGLISEAKYKADLHKIIERCQVLMARQAAR